MNANQIRSTFLKFFEEKNHRIVPSAPMVVKNDPTLMFTNAGMNQFKDYFLGNKMPDSPRIADTQKCLRVSGKHNDLEEVGVDTYHHTMFEMLGNWSFGDYFKEEAIAWAWELLHKVYGLDPDRIYITVFAGDEKDGLPADEEARAYWKKWVKDGQILSFGKKDNFWEMGDTGPCGPCSEIHVDIRSEQERKEVNGAGLVNTGHPQVIEIWNLVFIEFNRKQDASLETLPQKHVDTGMGLERLCMVLQGKKSNYDSDVFIPLIAALEKTTGHTYGREEETDIAMRVVADHVRAVSFSIADGQMPSNTGAGYVIRRILRRAIRYGYSFLNRDEPFIYHLVPVLTAQMGEAFPELQAQAGLIASVIREEESNFLHTLEKGIQRFEKASETLPLDKHPFFPGAIAFELFDTYGFPVDLTALMARERGFEGIDEEAYRACLQQQKDRSRQAGKTVTGDWVVLRDDAPQPFVGYDTTECELHITRYREVQTKGWKGYQFVFDQTPFYPEGGGQVGDTGTITADGETIPITDTKKENDLILHFAAKLPRDPSATFTGKVDADKRSATAKNHSATHLLHAALRSVLGPHVEQKGSLVDAGHLRFDFSHFQKVSKEELHRIEAMVQAEIAGGHHLDERRSVPMEEAREMGAMALFGEKYGDKVRVIRFGDSVELCGGIHVKNTKDIRAFHIVKETSVAAGIRRVEALTGEVAERYIRDEKQKREAAFGEVEEAVKELSSLDLKTLSPDEAGARLTEAQQKLAAIEKQGLAAEDANLERRLQDWKTQLQEMAATRDALRSQETAAAKAELSGLIRETEGIRTLIARYDADPTTIKNLAFAFREEYANLVMVLGSVYGGKPAIAVMVSDELVKNRSWNAGQWVRELAREIQGGGGGQAFFATAGGKDPGGMDKALERAREMVQAKVCN